MRVLSYLFFIVMMMTNTMAASAQTDSTFYINGSQGRLYTRLQLPEGQDKCPVVILSHGFGSDMNSPIIAALAEKLPAQGIGVVRFDFNGCGKSDGEFQNMTVPNEIEDLLSVIAWTQQQPFTESLSLIGHSQGGVVTGMAAGTCGSTQIKCVGLLSAAAVLREDALRGNTQGAKYNPWHLDEPYYIIPGRNLKLGRNYIQTAMNLPIFETTAKYNGPTLVLNGMADVVVPYTYGELYHKVLKNSTLELMPGQNHSLTENLPLTTEIIANWLVKQLNQ